MSESKYYTQEELELMEVCGPNEIMVHSPAEQIPDPNLGYRILKGSVIFLLGVLLLWCSSQYHLDLRTTAMEINKRCGPSCVSTILNTQTFCDTFCYPVFNETSEMKFYYYGSFFVAYVSFLSVVFFGMYLLNSMCLSCADDHEDD